MGDAEIPAHLIEEANLVLQESLPDKSRAKYEATYATFLDWQRKQGTESFAEVVLLSYFHQLAAKYKPPTLCSVYSMLKTVMINKNNINIDSYKNLLAFLKKKKTGYTPKKSRVLTSDQIERFLNEADDAEYLDIKVALIVGVYGACRGGEMCNLMISDVKDLGSSVHIKIPDTKTHRPRSFVIEEEHYSYIKKYMDLRPKDAKTTRFFLNFQKGKCTQQVIGKNKIGNMPQKIARYLKLEEPELYTGHSFRRTSATLLADSGSDMLSIKRHGGWKSDQVAEGYIEDSLGNKRKRAQEITKQIQIKKTNNDAGPSNPLVNKLKMDEHNSDAPTSKTSEVSTTKTNLNSPTKKIVHQTVYNITIGSVGTFSVPDAHRQT